MISLLRYATAMDIKDVNKHSKRLPQNGIELGHGEDVLHEVRRSGYIHVVEILK